MMDQENLFQIDEVIHNPIGEQQWKMELGWEQTLKACFQAFFFKLIDSKKDE